MRPIRLAVLVAPALLAALLLAPSTQAQPLVDFIDDPPTYLTAGSFPVSVGVGDFNGDHDPDLAVANQFSDDVSVLLGDADGSFTAAASVPPGGFPSGSFPASVAVGDFNGDGDPDLAVANASPFSPNVSVLLGDVGGSFTAGPSVAAGSLPTSIAVGDFDQNGDLDLAVADKSAGVIVVLRGDGAGRFTVAAIIASGSYRPAELREPASVAVGDFNDDHDPDLAVANQVSGEISVLRGIAGIGFADPTIVGNDDPRDPVSDPVSVAVGDFNQDADPDLAVAEQSPGQVRVLLGGAGDSFATATKVPPDTVAEGPLSSVAVGDFNRDGDPDLAATNPTIDTPKVEVLVGGDGGTFITDPDYNFTAGSNPGAVAVGDFNGDGKPDLAVANPTFSDRNVAVLINRTSINQAPVAAADAYTTAEDTPLTVAAPGVLGNDSDPDHNPLSAVLVSGPSHGTLTLNPDGSFTYTPASNHTGSDSFTYQASDGTLTSELATVTLTVTAINDPPTVTVAARGTCGRDDHSGTINLTVADVDNPTTELTLSVLSSNPTLVPTGNIGFAGSDAARTMTVSAVDGRSGTATLTVTVSDGQASGTVEVAVRVGGGGKDTLTGSTGADLLLAQSNNDTLAGEGGNDLLCGDSGSDTLSGGPGDDSLGGGSGSDRITGGPGADRFSGGSGTDTATDFTATEGDTSDGTIP
jgi:VCBS repeat-containing protein